ncbi:MAG: hypothetical protein JWM96_747 [Alphaproteobacteria bacterium]|nr:hypothetical protein [Alphaproteobacteria bacterium]
MRDTVLKISLPGIRTTFSCLFIIFRKVRSMKKTCLFFAAVFLLAFTAMPARAGVNGDQPEALPLEIGLLYNKLLERTPNYDSLLASNPSLRRGSPSYVGDARLVEQKIFLQGLYNSYSANTPMVVSRFLKVEEVNTQLRSALLQTIEMDDPVIYQIGGENYGIFLRNGKAISALAPPYEFDNFDMLQSYTEKGKGPVRASILIRPVAADPEDFIMPSGAKIHVILAEAMAVEITAPREKRIIVYKKFEVAPRDANALELPLNKGETVGGPASDVDPSQAPPRPQENIIQRVQAEIK